METETEPDLNPEISAPVIETRYHAFISWFILIGDLVLWGVFGIVTYTAVVQTGVDNDEALGMGILALLFGGMAWAGVSLLPYLFSTIRVDAAGLHILRRNSHKNISHPWSEVTRLRSWNFSQVLDVKGRRGQRLLSVDYMIKDFTLLLAALEFYIEESQIAAQAAKRASTEGTTRIIKDA